MQKRWVYLLICTTLSFFIFAGTSLAQFDAKEFNTNVKLTEEQRKVLENLHKEILETRKQVISKYAEYGIITEEKANKIKSRLDEHYRQLESNQFLPRWDKDREKGKDREKHKHHHP